MSTTGAVLVGTVQAGKLNDRTKVPQRPFGLPVILLYSPRYQNVTPSGATVISV